MSNVYDENGEIIGVKIYKGDTEEVANYKDGTLIIENNGIIYGSGNLNKKIIERDGSKHKNKKVYRKSKARIRSTIQKKSRKANRK